MEGILTPGQGNRGVFGIGGIGGSGNLLEKGV